MRTTIIQPEPGRAPAARIGRPIVLVVALLLSACDSTGSDGEARLLSLTHQDETRIFTLYIPSSLDTERPAPLLFALHGAPGTGEGMRLTTGLDELGDRNGWLVAYPDALGAWSAGCDCSTSEINGVDDLGFIERVIERISEEYSVDDRRIYATGFSNGGIMTYRLGCSMSDTFAAVAPLGASMTWEQARTCKLRRQIPIFSMIGTFDEAFPWKGTGINSGAFMPVDSTQVRWARLNGCRATPEVDYSPPKERDLNVRREVFPGCRDDGEVTLHAIEGGRHTWPTTANETLEAFFSRHSLAE
jgi:polyhydroxybutyrate depolymerase